MKLLGLIETDFVNYKEISMTLEFPYCSFKCNKEAGKAVCQNSNLVNSKPQDISIARLIQIFDNTELSKAIVFQGLEPLDSFDDCLNFIQSFRKDHEDDIVIYTGYYESEIQEKLNLLKEYPNIIVKFGRFLEEGNSHFDEVLGVNLASHNQYSKKIS